MSQSPNITRIIIGDCHIQMCLMDRLTHSTNFIDCIGKLNLSQIFNFKFNKFENLKEIVVGWIYNEEGSKDKCFKIDLTEYLKGFKKLKRIQIYRCNVKIILSNFESEWDTLKILNLSELKIIGGIPQSISNLSNLEGLVLYNNQLTGQIPESIGELKNLQTLNLSNNQLTGEIPESIGELKNLQTLNLSNNQLTGEIPKSIGELRDLKWLNLSQNQITGEIPESIGELKNLSELDLSNNQLTGNIFEIVDRIEGDNLPHLMRLDLSRNRFIKENLDIKWHKFEKFFCPEKLRAAEHFTLFGF